MQLKLIRFHEVEFTILQLLPIGLQAK